MKIITRNEVRKILERYDPAHDMGSGAPVLYEIKILIDAIVEQQKEIEELQMKVSRLIDTVPSAGRRYE